MKDAAIPVTTERLGEGARESALVSDEGGLDDRPRPALRRPRPRAACALVRRCLPRPHAHRCRGGRHRLDRFHEGPVVRCSAASGGSSGPRTDRVAQPGRRGGWGSSVDRVPSTSAYAAQGRRSSRPSSSSSTSSKSSSPSRVGDDEHAEAVFGRGGQAPHEVARAGRVQVGGGLVEDQEARVGHQGPREGEALALPAGDAGAVLAHQRAQAVADRRLARVSVRDALVTGATSASGALVAGAALVGWSPSGWRPVPRRHPPTRTGRAGPAAAPRGATARSSGPVVRPGIRAPRARRRPAVRR